MSLLTRAPDEVLARLAQEALAALLDRHLNDRMLFRNAPALADVRNAINKFSKGTYAPRQDNDMHMVGALLTECLRHRTPCLFSDIYDDLLAIDFTSDDPLTIKKRIKACIGSLPAHKIEFVRSLFTLLYRVRRLSNDDAMSATLSISGNFMSSGGSTSINNPIVSLFCPLLLQPSCSSYMSLRHVNESRTLRPVIAFLIDDFNDIGSGISGAAGSAAGNSMKVGVGGGVLLSHSLGVSASTSISTVGLLPQHKYSFKSASSVNSNRNLDDNAESTSMVRGGGGGGRLDNTQSLLLVDSASKKNNQLSHKTGSGDTSTKSDMDTNTNVADDDSSSSSSSSMSPNNLYNSSSPRHSDASGGFNAIESLRSPRLEDPLSQLNLGFMEQRILDALLNQQLESFYQQSMATDVSNVAYNSSRTTSSINNIGGGSRPGTPTASAAFMSSNSSSSSASNRGGGGLSNSRGGGHGRGHNNSSNSTSNKNNTSNSNNSTNANANSSAARKFSKRTKMIQDCKEIRKKIQFFEDSFLKQNGRSPTNTDKKNNNILDLYSDYRSIKRLIRDTAAVDIQRFFRRKLARRISNNNINNSSSSNSSISKAGIISIGVSASFDSANAIPVMSISPMNFSDSIQAGQGSGGAVLPFSNVGDSTAHSSDIYQLEQVYRQFLEEKKELKRDLKKFDDDFFAKHNRHPKRSDKEVIRPLYQKYNELKLKIDEIESHLNVSNSQQVQVDQLRSSTGHSDYGMGNSSSFGNKNSSSMNGEDDFDNSSSSNNINRGVGGGVNPMSSPLVAFNNDDSGDMMNSNFSASNAMSESIELPSGSMNASLGGSVSGSHDTPLLLLIEEKKALHNFLKDFERDFNQLNGRPVTRHDDILPVAEQYQRYKELKIIIKEMKSSI